jgi:cobalt/nickel transport system ATP-binding protein
MVFQDPDDQLFMPTVEEDVAFVPLNLGLPPAEVGEHVRRALEQVGAGHLQHRASHRLSTGEKRAVTLACVLAMSPDVLVMDEPTANLDPHGRRLLIELLRTFGHTRIIATHDLDLALDLCERTVALRDGRVAADGPTSRVLTDRALLERCRLELPLRLQGCPVCGTAGHRETSAG